MLKLGELPDKLEEGYISIPQFQRQFVWDIDDCAKLPDSVFKGRSVETDTLWQTHERMRQVKKIVGHVFPQAKEEYQVNYVLDGQQRLANSYAYLRGERICNGVVEEDYGKVALNLDESFYDNHLKAINIQFDTIDVKLSKEFHGGGM